MIAIRREPSALGKMSRKGRPALLDVRRRQRPLHNPGSSRVRDEGGGLLPILRHYNSAQLRQLRLYEANGGFLADGDPFDHWLQRRKRYFATHGHRLIALRGDLHATVVETRRDPKTVERSSIRRESPFFTKAHSANPNGMRIAASVVDGGTRTSHLSQRHAIPAFPICVLSLIAQTELAGSVQGAPARTVRFRNPNRVERSARIVIAIKCGV